MIKEYCFLSVLVFISTFVELSAAESLKGAASVSIGDKTYKYKYERFSPEERLSNTAELSQMTSDAAFQTLINLMFAKDVSQYKNLWAPNENNHIDNVSEETLMQMWSAWFEKGISLLYKFEFDGMVAYVVKVPAKNHHAQIVFSFVKIENAWYLTNKLAGVPVYRCLVNRYFDPTTGKTSPQPIAIYKLDSFVSSQRFINTADTRFLGDSNYKDLNNAYGENVIIVESGNSMVAKFQAGSYIQIPPSVSVSLINNQFTIKLDLVVEKLEDQQNSHKPISTIISRGIKGADSGFFLEVYQNSGYYFLRSEVGYEEISTVCEVPIELNIKTSIVWSFDGKFTTLVANGNQAISSELDAGTFMLANNIIPIGIGYYLSPGNNQFYGEISNLMISYQLEK